MILGSGDSDSSKMATGIVCSACAGFQLVCVPTSDDVKSRGAVSPATRATASTVPVEDAADCAAGATMLNVVRHCGDAEAEARFAQRVRDERKHLDRSSARRTGA